TEQYVVIGGVRYSHIVDTKTGYGLTNRVQATILARNGLTSDPLSKVACILGPKRAQEIARRYRAKSGVIVIHD
ncbi:MAG: FAD:protein FMN transferase, partial [Fimbriimonas sp.]